MESKRTNGVEPGKFSRECLIKFLYNYESTNRERIRFVNQVLDFIKLSAVTGTEFEFI